MNHHEVFTNIKHRKKQRKKERERKLVTLGLGVQWDDQVIDNNS